MKKLIALVARHGETVYNETEIIRSWNDPPLNQDGLKQAKQARDFLKKYKFSRILCSPLLRAFVTADIIADGRMVWQHRGLFPWNLGVFGGLPKGTTAHAVDLFVKGKQVQVPNGESLNAFEERIFAFFNAALADAQKCGLTLFVCHNSVITALSHLMTGEEADRLKDTVKPGGVAEIIFDGKHHSLVPVFGKPEVSTFGPS